MGARLEATEFSSEEKILKGLQLVGTGLALWDRLQQPYKPTRVVGGGGGGGGSLSASVTVLSLNARPDGASGAAGGEQDEVHQSISLLCERVCEVAMRRAQADAASKASLMAAKVNAALSAVLALRAGLSR